MSVPATTAVWEHSQATGADLIVMLALADAANADGRNAFPGMPRLVKWARRGERAVLASIKRSIDRGELRRTSPGHRKSPAVYEIVLPGLETWWDGKGAGTDTQTRDERVQLSSGKGEAGTRERVQLPGSSPLIELQEQEQRASARFEDFWKAYPARNGRKLEKRKAQEKWERLSVADKVLALVGLRPYAQACDRGEQLAKDAFRWLRDRSFEEWAELAQAQASRPRGPSQPLPECRHGVLIKAYCEDCDAEGVPQDKRAEA